jgi:large subunit ribosomal protein L9
MQVILLERVENLGQMGDEVTVKDGFARNFLLPRKKAMRATKEARERFEKERTQLEARNLERKKDAEQVAAKLDGQSSVLLRQASEGGQLYGSVTARDVAEAFTAKGFSLDKRQIEIVIAIKTLGIHKLKVVLHPEVSVSVQVNVARSEEEAQRQTETPADAAAFFEEGAAPKPEGAAEAEGKTAA